MTKEVVEGKQPVGEEMQDRFFADFPYPTYEEWRAESEKALKGANWEKTLLTKTYEDIQLQPMYRMEDIEGITHCDSAPGSYPFVRGTSPTGYLTKPWEICQECDEPLASAFHGENPLIFVGRPFKCSIVQLDYSLHESEWTGST